MTNNFQVKLFFDSNKSSFQNIMDKLYKEYLKENIESISLDNKNNTCDKKGFASTKDER